MSAEAEEHLRILPQETGTGRSKKCSRPITRCALRPWRAFINIDQLRAHVVREHNKARLFTPTSRKQLNLVHAIFDEAQIRGEPPVQPSFFATL